MRRLLRKWAEGVWAFPSATMPSLTETEVNRGFFVSRSDSTAGGLKESCIVQEVRQESQELLPLWCVSRPSVPEIHWHVAGTLSNQQTHKQQAISMGCFGGCLTSQQHATVSQGRICSDNCTCCHTEIDVADQTFYFTQSHCSGPTSQSADPITPGAWQGSHWSASF